MHGTAWPNCKTTKVGPHEHKPELVIEGHQGPRLGDDGKPYVAVVALPEYSRALDNCSAPGVVADALRDLELIRIAGVEGLEPVFDLLKSELKS
jgi:hypothetical protein